MRYPFVYSCNQAQSAYLQQSKRLMTLTTSSRNLLANSSLDDVADTDRSKITQLSQDYQKAINLLRDVPKTSECTPYDPISLSQQARTYSSFNTEANVLYYSLANDETALQAAIESKKLADAHDALNSTIESANSLSNDTRLAASTRTQINQAVALAQSVAQSGDYNQINSARKQLDEIVDKVNSALNSENATLLNIEKAVANVKTTADSSGSYVNSAMSILKAANLQASWGLLSMQGACSITNQQANSWLAAFCSATPNQIYIRSNLGPEYTHDAYFADAMRHEIGHYLIYRRCGTTVPASIGSASNAESTASSYAVLYLGADAVTLNRAADSRYHMDDNSFAAAARIHSGRCQ